MYLTWYAGVTQGKVITAKHFLFALDLYNPTGHRKVIDINKKLFINCDLTCKIKNSFDGKSQEISFILLLKPKDDSKTVLIFYWVDNFDVHIERQQDEGGAINTTGIAAFQEASNHSVQIVQAVSFESSSSRRIETATKRSHVDDINIKKEPPKFTTVDEKDHISMSCMCNIFYCC